MTKMIYIDHDSTDANFNFALEKYCMTELAIGDRYFLFWRTEPTLMIGRHQNAYQEINMDYAKTHDVNIVRRVTGGGTIYTDMNGWQFSFIERNPKSHHIDFSKYTKPIIEALKMLGIEATLSGRNDLLIKGKKFSGNAQHNQKSVNLHHGSILFNTDLEALVRALNVDDEKIISKGIQSVRERVTNVMDHMAVPMTSLEFRDAMLDVLLKDMDIYHLTHKDIQRVCEIKAAQFDTWEWNMGKNPSFNRSKEQRFAGGKLRVSLTASKGMIKEVAFNGDFFSNKDLLSLEEGLVNCPLEESALKDRLKALKAESYFHQITNDEIASLML